MTNNNLIRKLKRHAVIVEHNYLQIAQFLRVAQFFVFKRRKELEDNNGQMSPVAKRKNHQQHSNSLRTHEFIQ